ncbi:B12-binding domain-containing protein [Streptomyces sodiiphilus]
MTEPAAPSASRPTDGTGPGLATGAVARRIGVAPTTLRSWDRRYGIGPAGHLGGRHRRWSPPDIAVLEHMCRLTARGVPPAEAARRARAASAGQPEDGQGGQKKQRAPGRSGARVPAVPAQQPGGSNALPLGSVRPECRGLARAAVRLDVPAVDRLLEQALAAHGLVVCWNEVIVPAMRAVGRKWAASGERYVEVEHLLSWHVSSALRRRAAAAAPAGGGGCPPVLLACAPGELHTLPLEALAAGLAERGRPALMFGADVPARALEEAVRRTGPAAVVLWAQSRGTADREPAHRIRSAVWGMRGARVRVTVMLAGPGWAGGGRFTGVVRPRGLREALDALAAPRG